MGTNSTNRAELAPFWRRSCAFAFDLILVFWMAEFGGTLGAALAVLTPDWSIAPPIIMDILLTEGFLLGFAFWWLSGFFLNFVIYQGLVGATLGKRLFGIKVQSAHAEFGIGTAGVRSVGYLVSWFPFGMGAAWMLLDSRSRCWHDFLVGTEVVRSEPPAQVTTQSVSSESEKEAA